MNPAPLTWELYRQAAIAYEQGKQRDDRKKAGQFYTPPVTVQHLVKNALAPLFLRPDGTEKNVEELLALRICDPAMGAGFFLVEAFFQLAEQIQRQARRENLSLEAFPERLVTENLWGADIDEQAVSMARKLVWSATGKSQPPASRVSEHFQVADSLKTWEKTFSQDGYDLVLGNPPFLGGRKIRRALGDAYFAFLTCEFAPGASGNADLCAYFFRLAEKLLRPGGICAMLATNTISEGDTRKTGLDSLVSQGGQIFRAETFPWPGDASVQISAVYLRFHAAALPCFLDGKRVSRIPTSLREFDAAKVSRTFPQNQNLCFQGSVLAAKGFILTPEEATALREIDPRNAEVILPYYTGDDVFRAPDTLNLEPPRWVIAFHDRSLLEAQRFFDVFRWVEERVLPVRKNARRDAHRNFWWQFGDKRPTLTKIIQEQKLKWILLQTRHAKYLTPTRVPANAIYSESVVLFPSESFGFLALLNSGIHEAWVRQNASTLGRELRYTPTCAFNTFRLPPWNLLETVGETFFKTRRALCLQKNCGLTELYNLFHHAETPILNTLRDLQETLDRQTMAAYGWEDLADSQETHGFFPTPLGIRFTLAPNLQKRILQRLAAENGTPTAGMSEEFAETPKESAF